MTLSDKDMQKRVIDELYWDSSIDSSEMVPTWSARNAAVKAEEYTGEMIDVVNDLVVTSTVPVKGVC